MRLGYASFAKGKESTGIERAIISSVFGKDVLSSEALKKVTHLIAEEHTYFNFFKALASPEQLQFYQQKLSGSVTEDVQKLRDKLMSKIDNLDRNVLVFQLSQAVGFGGAIHNFKNFVLRGKEKYFEEFLANYEVIRRTIQELKKLKNLTPADKQALAGVMSVFEQYHTVINHAKHLHHEGEGIAEIDTMVSINDSPAVAGLKELVKGSSLGNFGVTAAYSFQVYTKKLIL